MGLQGEHHLAMSTDSSQVRVAALADIHMNETASPEWSALLKEVSENADVIVLAGDLTNRGVPREAELLADSISSCRVPVVAVLGNHDYECGQQDEVGRILCDAGMFLLDDEPREIHDVGFAGLKGFCGGFDRHALAPFGEDTIKHFVHETVDDALRLEASLARLRTRHKITVLHYAPVRATVEGEPLEIYPFLGSSRLGDPIDHADVTAVVHGHAHRGTHLGATLGGTPVYNVALPLMRTVNPDRPYLVLDL